MAQPSWLRCTSSGCHCHTAQPSNERLRPLTFASLVNEVLRDVVKQELGPEPRIAASLELLWTTRLAERLAELTDDASVIIICPWKIFREIIVAERLVPVVPRPRAA